MIVVFVCLGMDHIFKYFYCRRHEVLDSGAELESKSGLGDGVHGSRRWKRIDLGKHFPLGKNPQNGYFIG
jgi:hypothetical protein